MKKDVPADRLCRLNGQQPTVRERWQAFHRLYRLAHGQGVWQDFAAGDCFRVLWRDWAWFRLLNTTEQSPSRVHLPKPIRRQLLERDKRQRRKHPEWLTRDQHIAKVVRDQHGIEVTPGEVGDVRAKVLAAARQRMPDLPLDDNKAWTLLCQAIQNAKAR